MATISSEGDKITVRYVLEEKPLGKSSTHLARTILREYDHGAGNATIILHQEELEMVVRGLMSMEMFSDPSVMGADMSAAGLTKWANLRALINTLANVPWDERP